MIPRIYLAGAITAATDGERGNVWRKAIAEDYRIVEWVNPLDYESQSQEYGTLTDAAIIERDEALIESCDAIIMRTDVSIYQWGTPQEQLYAYQIGVPVILLFDGDPADLSPWCRHRTTYFATSVEEAVESAYRLCTGCEYEEGYISTDDPYFVQKEYDDFIRLLQRRRKT